MWRKWLREKQPFCNTMSPVSSTHWPARINSLCRDGSQTNRRTWTQTGHPSHRMDDVEQNVGPCSQFPRSHLRADQVLGWIQHHLRVQDVPTVLQSPLSYRDTTGGQTIITGCLVFMKSSLCELSSTHHVTLPDWTEWNLTLFWNDFRKMITSYSPLKL